VPLTPPDSLCDTQANRQSTTTTRTTTHNQLQWLLHPFNGLFSRTTWVSRHQKGKPSGFCWSKGWWVAVASAGPYANHLHLAPKMPASHHSFFTGRMPFLPPNQQRQWQGWELSSAVMLPLVPLNPPDSLCDTQTDRREINYRTTTRMTTVRLQIVVQHSTRSVTHRHTSIYIIQWRRWELWDCGTWCNVLPDWLNQTRSMTWHTDNQLGR